MNGIKHIRSSPFHLASNSLAERAVQTIKGGLKKMGGDLETRMFEFLGRYPILVANVMSLIAIINHVDTDTIITGLLAITMQSNY